ncbi:MAG TPA: hypothetical protein ENH02_00255 [Bacteroidetes bacterium]|nr:hypothetical protein [Bacteroidota bacterium]
MDEKFSRLIGKAKNATGQKEIRNAISLLNKNLKNTAKDIPLLHARAELHVKLQEFGEAVNDYRLILSYDNNDKLATGQIEHLSTILRFSGNDIYASPNTNLDPWLE